ncbi:MAG: glycosyltransferase family 2 protein [Melioribacteraceae bacterium]|nr:glycosyltransferase family 2 protein [Melioribacteraceae bacterium]
MIDLSIIIINYNGEKYLEDCLCSIEEYTSKIVYETIVVDNGTVDFNLRSWQSRFPNVHFVINEYNKGFAAANNDGLGVARGKYVLFLNNDTRLISNIFYDVFSYCEKINSPIFAGCQLLNSDLSKQESIVEFPSLWNGFTENMFLYKLFPNSKLFNKYYQNHLDYYEPVEADVIKGAFMFCPRDIIDSLNGFDDRFFFYSEETDLCKRFKDMGGRILFLPQYKIIHYGGSTSDKNLWFKYKNQTIGKIQYYQKHFSGFNFISVIIIHFIGLFLRGVINCTVGIILFRKNLFIKGFFFFRQLFVYPNNVFKDKKES